MHGVKQQVGISRTGTGTQEGGHELISQPCLQLLPCYSCVFISHKINVNKFMCIVYFIQIIQSVFKK